MSATAPSEPGVVIEDLLGELLSASRWGGALSARLSLHPPWGLRFPATPRAGFHLVTQGSVWLRVAGEAPRELFQGDLVVLPHGPTHVLSDAPRGPAATFPELLDDPTTRRDGGVIRNRGGAARPVTAGLLCGVYHFEHAEPHPVLAELPAVVTCAAGLGDGPLQVVARLLQAELARAGPGSQAVVSRLLDLLFILAVRDHVERTRDPARGWLRALKDPGLARALLAMHRRPAEPWTVAALAAVAGMSATGFKRRFTEQLRDGPAGYLTDVRMALARRLLRDGDRPLSEVARAVGYDSEFAFNRAFRRVTGMPPGRYRRSTAQATSGRPWRPPASLRADPG